VVLRIILCSQSVVICIHPMAEDAKTTSQSLKDSLTLLENQMAALPKNEAFDHRSVNEAFANGKAKANAMATMIEALQAKVKDLELRLQTANAELDKSRRQQDWTEGHLVQQDLP